MVNWDEFEPLDASVATAPAAPQGINWDDFEAVEAAPPAPVASAAPAAGGLGDVDPVTAEAGGLSAPGKTTTVGEVAHQVGDFFRAAPSGLKSGVENLRASFEGFMPTAELAAATAPRRAINDATDMLALYNAPRDASPDQVKALAGDLRGKILDAWGQGVNPTAALKPEIDAAYKRGMNPHLASAALETLGADPRAYLEQANKSVAQQALEVSRIAQESSKRQAEIQGEGPIPADYWLLDQTQRREKYPGFWTAETFFPNAPQLLTTWGPVLAGSLMGGNAGAAAGGAVGTLLMYPQFVQEVQADLRQTAKERSVPLSEEDVAHLSMSFGLANAALENAGEIFSLMKLPGGRSILKGRVGQFLSEVARATAGEGLEEGMQTAVTNVAENRAGLSTDVLAGTKEALIGGAVGGGLLSVLPTAINAAASGGHGATKVIDRAMRDQADRVAALPPIHDEPTDLMARAKKEAAPPSPEEKDRAAAMVGNLDLAQRMGAAEGQVQAGAFQDARANPAFGIAEPTMPDLSAGGVHVPADPRMPIPVGPAAGDDPARLAPMADAMLAMDPAQGMAETQGMAGILQAAPEAQASELRSAGLALPQGGQNFDIVPEAERLDRRVDSAPFPAAEPSSPVQRAQGLQERQALPQGVDFELIPDGQRRDLPVISRAIPMTSGLAIDEAAHQAATSPANDLSEPTQAQKKAGNYKLGHVQVHGLDISIENPAGSTRSGTDPRGKPWSIEMNSHYGYIKRTEGKDGDHVDVFVGPDPESRSVYVVNQVKPGNRHFDEHKALLGFNSPEEAKAGYLANYAKGWKGLGSMVEMDVDAFKSWLKNGDTTKPASVASSDLKQARPSVKSEEAGPPKKASQGGKPTVIPLGAAEQAASMSADEIVAMWDEDERAPTPPVSKAADKPKVSAAPGPLRPKEFYIIRGKRDAPEYVKVSGSKVRIKGGEDLDLFVWNDRKDRAESYAVTEGQTGMRLGAGPTREGALRDAEFNLEETGQKLRDAIKREVGNGVLSPRYQPLEEGAAGPKAPKPETFQVFVAKIGKDNAPTGKYAAVKGEPVSIEGYDAFEFYAHPNQEAKGWAVSEAITGAHVGKGRNRSEAIESARSVLDHMTPAKLREMTDNWVGKYGAAPKTAAAAMERGVLQAKAEKAALSKGATAQEREAFLINKYASIMGGGKGFVTYFEKMADAIRSGDVNALREKLHAGNKQSRRFFAEMTGEKAGTQRDVEAALDKLRPAAGDALKSAAGHIAKVAGKFAELNKLLGERGSLSVEPVDANVWPKAKAILAEAWQEVVAAGQDLREFVRLAKAYMGPKGRPYFDKFVREEIKGEPAAKPHDAIAAWVKDRLERNHAFSNQDLFDKGAQAFGGTMGAGAFTAKDAYDAMELGVNQFLAGDAERYNPATATASIARTVADGLTAKVKTLLPTQNKRTSEQDEFQQFSTPPALAYVSNWLAKIKPGETMLEPSAGIGGLAVFAKNAGAKVVVNELSPRRREILTSMGFDRIFGENAEQLNNILPKDVRPSVIVMNPPFSASAGRVEGMRDTRIGGKHVEQALARLAPGGRLVAIVGQGMADNRSAFQGWWNRIKSEYNVRANISVSGKDYGKYGTTFDNQVLVIDKTGATPKGGTRTDAAKSAGEVATLLQEIRDDRRYPEDAGRSGKAERPADQPGSEAAASGDRREADDERSADSSAPGVGKPNRPVEQGVEAGDRPRRDRPTPPSKRPAASDGVPDADGRRGSARPGSGRAEPAGSGGASDGGAGLGDGGKVGELRVKAVKAEAAKEEINEASVFDAYRPSVAVPGAKAHPTKLAESAAMAAVRPVSPDYSPSLPAFVVKDGLLSDAQLEAIIYAGNAHKDTLADGRRKGFFIGDGTGVGKGREISGILWDNWNQGRKKHVWVSEKSSLFADAKRDLAGIGWNADLLFDLSKIKAGKALEIPEGILFTTYDTLKSETQGKNGGAGASRGDQIRAWLGPDFDGVVAFDEAHNMGNAVEMKGGRGKKKAAKKALAGITLQAAVPNARVVYVSATGATEVANLSYADRLGLWGEGSAFNTREKFVTEVSAGGVAAMELVARDLKSMGLYLARNLDFNGVTYDRLEHTLSPEQTEIYDALAEAWQVVLENINAALEETGGSDSAMAKSAATSAFWGAHQRFFNQVITSMQTPAVVNAIRRDMKAGKAAVIQLVSTMEASTGRALSRLEEGMDLEDLDLTPRDQLLQYLERSFPTVAYEETLDASGNVIMTPVKDSEGRPVHDARAVARKEALLDKLASIRVPDSPIDMILNAFGPEAVAEITGRSRRVVWGKDDSGARRKVIEKRSDAKARVEADEFMGDTRQILIFSDKGGTGRSYHADKAAKNQRPRVHYLLQPGWRADKAVQGFGRTHRSNQAQPPHYALVTTNLKAQKRFLSSIARRLDQLGALTKGQRQAGSQGFFDARDNLESSYARDALKAFLRDVYIGAVPGVDQQDFEQQTGLSLAKSDDIEVTQFLNRLLSLKTGMMDKVFDAFSERMDGFIRRAMEDGTLDAGLETMKALKIDVAKEEVVHVDERTKAETKYVALDLTQPTRLRTFGDVEDQAEAGFFLNKISGQVWAASKATQSTNPSTGAIEEDHHLYSVRSLQFVSPKDLAEKYERIDKEQARELWDRAVEAAPKTLVERKNLITGVILPVWNRLKGNARIVRVQSSDGRRMIGRLINDVDLADTLQNLGASAQALEITPAQAVDDVMENGATLWLANGWRIKRSVVAGESRLEILGPEYADQNEMTRKGVLYERHNFRGRYFIPSGESAASILGDVVKARPISRVERARDAAEGSEHPRFSFAEQGASGLTREELQGEIEKYRPLLADDVKIVAHQSQETLPLLIREAIEEAGGRSVPGVFWDGKTHLVADNLYGPKGVRETLGHELFHAGAGRLRRRLAGKYGLRKANAKVDRQLRLAYGANRAAIQELAATDYRGVFDMSAEEGRLGATEEWLANRAIVEAPRWYDRYVAAIRAFMRAVGEKLGLDLDFSDAEVRAFIGSVRGETRRVGAPSFIAMPETQPAFAMARFVAAAGGGVNIGEVGENAAAAMGKRPAPIRLLKEDLGHIESQRGRQIREMGYENAATFVEAAAKGYSAIYPGNVPGTFIIARKDKKPHETAFIKLVYDQDGDFYAVKSAVPMRSTFFKNKKPLWEGAPTLRRSPLEERTPGAVSGQSDFEKSVTTPDQAGKPKFAMAPRLVTPATTQALGPQNMNPLADGLRRSSIIKRLSEGLNLPIRLGRYARKAAGIYKTGPQVVRTRLANNVEVVAHEIAHHIQEKPLMILPATMPAEVQAMAYPGAKDLNKEGFAEFVRYWITDPDQAQAGAPDFMQVFEAELSRRPDLSKLLTQTREAYQLWQAGSDVQKVMSVIRRGADVSAGRRVSLPDLYTQIVDELHPLKELSDMAAARGGKKLDAEDSPFLLAWANRGWTGKAQHFLEFGPFQLSRSSEYERRGPALKDILKPIYEAGKIDLLDAYLLAKRATADARVSGGFDGVLSLDNFLGTVDELERAHPEIAEAAQKLYAYNDELLTYLVEAGRLAQSAADGIRSRNDFYAPLYRVMDDAGEIRAGLSRTKFGKVPNPVKRLKGSARDVYSPVENLIYNTYAMINAAERNRVGEAILRLASIPGMGDLVEVKPFYSKSNSAPLEGMVELVRRVLRKADTETAHDFADTLTELLGHIGNVREISSLIERGAPTAEIVQALKDADLTADELGEFDEVVRMWGQDRLRTGPNETIFYQDGEPVLVELAPDLHKAVTESMNVGDNLLMSLLQAPASWLRAGATLPLEFSGRNAFRDQQEAFLNSHAVLYVPFVEMFRGMAHVLKADEAYKRFYASGAAHAALVSLDRNYISKSLDLLAGGKGRQMTGWIKKPFEFLRSVSEVMEEATRVQYHAKLMDKLGDKADMRSMVSSGVGSRDLTIDFTRGGANSGVKMLRRIAAFWNAGVQGLDKTIRAAKANPAAYTAKAFMLYAVPTAILRALHWDDRDYEELPAWRRALFWNVVVRNSKRDKAGKLIEPPIVLSLPRAHVPGVIFGGMAEAFLDWTFKNDPALAKRSVKELLGMIPMPGVTAVSLGYGLVSNYSTFLERPIEPRSAEGLPPYLRYDSRTSLAARGWGKAMNAVGLGDASLASPAKVDYLARSLTGGMGKLALDAVDKGLEWAGAAGPFPEAKWYEMLGVRAFVARVPSQGSRSVEEFYDRWQQVQWKQEEVKEVAGIRDAAKLVNSIKPGAVQMPKDAEYKLFQESARAMSALHNAARFIENNPKITASEKRQNLDQIADGITTLARRALGRK